MNLQNFPPNNSRIAGDSTSPTAGSFIRPSRPFDSSSDFLEVLEKKYSSTSGRKNNSQDVIQISGKTVEEVGFEKIERQLAGLTELKIVILDSLCVKGIHSNSGKSLGSASSSGASLPWLHEMKVEQLDLSRNLLETWTDILLLVDSLPRLRGLEALVCHGTPCFSSRLIECYRGNRFRTISASGNSVGFQNFAELERT